MNPRYAAVRDDLQASIMNRIDFSREVPDKEVLDLIDERLTVDAPGDLLFFTLEDKKRLRQDLFHSIRRLDVLQDHCAPEEVLGKLAYLAGFNPSAEPKSACQLLVDFDWDKVPTEDICIPEGLF